MVTDTMEDRACELGNYIVENRATVRAVAKKFGLSKSSVHKDVTARLYWVDRALYEQVRAVLEENKRERHLRGGAATREKYRKLHEQEERAARVRPLWVILYKIRSKHQYS